MIISRRIAELRARYQLKQKDLADRLDVTPKTISFYELGQRNPPIDMVVKLAKMFHVSTDYLLLEEEPISIKSASIRLSEEEINIIEQYRTLNDTGKEAIQSTLRALALPTLGTVPEKQQSGNPLPKKEVSS